MNFVICRQRIFITSVAEGEGSSSGWATCIFSNKKSQNAYDAFFISKTRTTQCSSSRQGREANFGKRAVNTVPMWQRRASSSGALGRCLNVPKYREKDDAGARTPAHYRRMRWRGVHAEEDFLQLDICCFFYIYLLLNRLYQKDSYVIHGLRARKL